MKNHKQLTKSEFQVMDILWNLPEQSGFTSDILKRISGTQTGLHHISYFSENPERKGFCTF